MRLDRRLTHEEALRDLAVREGSAILSVDGTELLAPGIAVVVLAAWAAVAAVTGNRSMQRRDIS